MYGLHAHMTLLADRWLAGMKPDGIHECALRDVSPLMPIAISCHRPPASLIDRLVRELGAKAEVDLQ